MTYRVSGCIDDYDTEGEGTCLTTALIAYAADCRRAASDHQNRSAMLLAEAERAERAATAAEIPDGQFSEVK